MTTAGFIGGICCNCVSSFVLFGFKYFWKMFKLMKSKPWVISQVKSVIMMIIPIALFLRYPVYLLFTIYCMAAIYYGIYSTYKGDVEYEKIYYLYRKHQREQEIENAREMNQEEHAQQFHNNAEQNTQSEQKTETMENDNTGYHPFDDVESLEDAKIRYHKLLKMGHPDNGGDEEFTKFLTEEYNRACKKLTDQGSYF